MKRILSVLVALLLVMSIFSAALGEVAEPNEDFWYLDEANVLSESTEGEIFFANQRLYDACGAEIVIVAVDTTGRLGMEDYTYTLFNDWQIGGDTYLGFLLVMAIDDDDYYAMTGTKLEGYVDAAAVQNLLDTYLEPDFARKDYDAGARKFFEAAYAEVTDQLNLNLSVERGIADYQNYVAQQQSQSSADYAADYPVETDPHNAYYGPSWGQIILIILIIVWLSGRSWRRRGGMGSGLFSSMLFHSFLHTPRGPRPPFGGGPMPPPPPGPRGGFGGPSRHSSGSRNFGGASRPSGGSRSFGGGGFGGASRHSGGGSRGPSTRGGGAGRGGRR